MGDGEAADRLLVDRAGGWWSSGREAMLDVDAEMGFVDRADICRHHLLTFRFVAVYSDRTEQWHRYVTNTRSSMLVAEHFTAVYAACWETELLPGELEAHYRLDHMSSRGRPISESLLYAAVLTLVVSRRLHRLKPALGSTTLRGDALSTAGL